MNKNSFKQITDKIMRSDRGAGNPRIMHPTRDWGIGLLVGIILFAATAGWGTLSFLDYRNEAESYTGSSNEEVVVYREKLVEAALEIYKEREVKHQQLLENYRGAEPLPVSSEESGETAGPRVETENSEIATSSETVSLEADIVEESFPEEVEVEEEEIVEPEPVFESENQEDIIQLSPG